MARSNFHQLWDAAAERPQKLTGKGTIAIDTKIRRGRHQWNPTYNWHVQKQADCLEILQQVLPYLIIKKEKAERLILYLKFRKQKGKYARYGIVERTFLEGKPTEIKDILELV